MADKALIRWISSSSSFVKYLHCPSRRLPVHLSRYHPDYKLSAPPTSSDILTRAYELARERLDFVYVGNIHINGMTETPCPACGAVVVERRGFGAASRTRDGRCPSCGEDIGIVT